MKIQNKHHVIELTNKLCNDLGLIVESSSDQGFGIFTDHASGVKLILEFQEPRDFRFYFLVRTFDVVYNGDRSDAHVILSLMFSCFLRSLKHGISCSMFDIAHPVVEDEIWGRYLIPEQVPYYDGISTWEELFSASSEIIKTLNKWRLIFWRFAGCPCAECREKAHSTENEIDFDLPSDFSKALDSLQIESTRFNYNNRSLPTWNFYYDINREITIIKSKELASYMNEIHSFNGKENPKEIQGINGLLLVDAELKNYIEKVTIEELDDLLENLTNKHVPHRKRFVMENMAVAISSPYIVALGRLGGLPEFKSEREELRRRHNLESEVLFPISEFNWEKEIQPDRFEDLIKELLERDSNIVCVRKPAPTNQGDKGRDLLIEWIITDRAIVSDVQPPTRVIKVVGQCKCSKSVIGKSKVLDIRDTVETHNSSGYFLAVSTQISAPLTEKLETLQAKGIWTHWWNKEEIESRLSKNPELLAKFSDVVQAKEHIKFYEK